MTTSPTGPTSAVERVARRLAARERLGDEGRWGETSPEFRDLYRGAAREVIALVQEPAGEPGGRGVLRDRIADAIRDAACTGDCGKTEEECAKERIQPFAWHHGRLAVVEGEPEQFADAVLAVLPEPADRAAAPVCICGHPEERHFEDVCQTCGCGDYLEPQDAAEMIARWRQAALKVRAGERSAALREAADWYAQQGKTILAASQVAADLRRRAEVELRRMADETPSMQLARASVDAMAATVQQPPVCEGFVWIGQSFATCDRCAQPAWEHDGEDVPVEGAGPFDLRRTVRPWKPGQADAIRAKWEQPAAGARQDQATTDEPQRCARCTHPKRDHDGRTDHRAKHSPLVAGEPWCHACNAQCDYTATAGQDGAQSSPPPA